MRFRNDVMTAEIARGLWSYDLETGIFRWKIRSHHRLQVGDVAGCGDGHGRWVLTFQGKKRFASRVAWLIVTGAWPEMEIDHIDCDPLNNKWNNLRQATRTQQNCNMKTRKDNPLGAKGVRKRTKTTFEAYVSLNGERRMLGPFKTLEEAKAARDAVAAELHGEFQRGA